MENIKTDDALLTYRDLASFLKVSESKLRRDVSAKRIPFTRVSGRSIRFKKSVIEIWLRDHTYFPKGGE